MLFKMLLLKGHVQPVKTAQGKVAIAGRVQPLKTAQVGCNKFQMFRMMLKGHVQPLKTAQVG
jgi:hypothetical protein